MEKKMTSITLDDSIWLRHLEVSYFCSRWSQFNQCEPLEEDFENYKKLLIK